MNETEHLIEQEIARHEAHLKRVDELIEAAKESPGTDETHDALVDAIEAERHELADVLRRMQGKSSEHWQSDAEVQFGPLAPWNVIARLLERLVERAEGRVEGRD